jgi:peptidoglycan hydrolase CwlO-like protein
MQTFNNFSELRAANSVSTSSASIMHVINASNRVDADSVAVVVNAAVEADEAILNDFRGDDMPMSAQYYTTRLDYIKKSTEPPNKKIQRIDHYLAEGAKWYANLQQMQEKAKTEYEGYDKQLRALRKQAETGLAKQPKSPPQKARDLTKQYWEGKVQAPVPLQPPATQPQTPQTPPAQQGTPNPASTATYPPR